MSGRCRSSSRKCVTERQILSNSSLSIAAQVKKCRKTNTQRSSNKTSLTRRRQSQSFNYSSTRKTSNKRTRLNSEKSNKLNQKKIKELSDDDNNEIEEIIQPIERTEIDRCAICLDDCVEIKQLDKCGHTFCTACIDYYFQTVKPQCPCCFTIYGEIRGNQPVNGSMTFDTSRHRLPGFERDSRGTIRIDYYFPNGIQDESHPNPGMPFYGTTRRAYLPDNHDGRHVFGLLQRAFELRQIFTVGQSRTTGYDNVVTWNDIHHKTSITGGVENFGYPDKTYLNRVQQELAAKGIK